MPKRKRTDPALARQDQAHQRSLDQLATYNAERARGIVHTPEWDERMAKSQARYDADLAQEAQWAAENHTAQGHKRVNLPLPSPPGSWTNQVE